MLATAGAPFDSDSNQYEIKWDGIRALLFKDASETRLLSRNGNDISSLCPAVLDAPLPPGAVLDGELVAFADGLPDFASTLVKSTEKLFVAFDLLYTNYLSLVDEPLSVRRDLLESLLHDNGVVTISPTYSDGRALFERISEEKLEGIVAKRLDGRYYPGKRTDDWIKIKRRQYLFCAVIGFVPGDAGFKSLLLATNESYGTLSYVGKVGSGFTDACRTHLAGILDKRVVTDPVIPVTEKAIWIQPDVFVRVRFSERTSRGILRSAVFVDIVGA